MTWLLMQLISAMLKPKLNPNITLSNQKEIFVSFS